MAKQVRPAFCDSAKRSDPSRSSPYKEPERAYSIMARVGYPAHRQAGYIPAVFLTSHHRFFPCKPGGVHIYARLSERTEVKAKAVADPLVNP